MASTDNNALNLFTQVRNLLPLLMVLTATASCKSSIPITGQDYVHLVYEKTGKSAVLDQLTIIYLEGDGIPWIDHGTRPSADPTPSHALAFNLYKATARPAWYITRPCYNHVRSSNCDPSLWTDARYSEKVVASLTAAINSNISKHHTQRVVLVGYSGGGTLAYLIAPRIPEVMGVITIAGNLDTDAWTDLHHYLPMKESLNPANLADITIPHLAMIGDRDTNIPFESQIRFFKDHPNSHVQHFAKFDHVCCWEKDWAALLDAALHDMHIK